MHKIFNNKVIVITGGSSGIGAALVKYFLMYGSKVAICGRNQEKLLEQQKQYLSYGENFFIMPIDVSQEKECQRFIETIITQWKNIDVLINNAGVSMRSLFEHIDMENVKKIMDINFMGSVYCTKFALPFLIQSKGSIVSIASVAGHRATPGRSIYSASKFALIGFMESLRLELKQHHINVLTVSPGFIQSDIRNSVVIDTQQKTIVNEKKFMTAETCAQHIINAIIKKKKHIILTPLGKTTVWINKLFPRLADNLVYRFYFDKNHQLKK